MAESAEPDASPGEIVQIAQGVDKSTIGDLLEDAEYVNLQTENESIVMTPAAIVEMDSEFGPGKAVLGTDEEGWPLLLWYTAGLKRIKRYMGIQVTITLSGKKILSGGRTLKQYTIELQEEEPF